MPSVALGQRVIGASAARRSCRRPTQAQGVIGPCDVARAQNHRRRSSRVAMKQRVHVHRGLWELQRAPSWGTQSDSRSDDLKRRVTTATPVRSPTEQDKEPSRRSFELTTHERLRQEALTHSRQFAAGFAWHLRVGSIMRQDSSVRPQNGNKGCNPLFAEARYEAIFQSVVEHRGHLTNCATRNHHSVHQFNLESNACR